MKKVGYYLCVCALVFLVVGEIVCLNQDSGYSVATVLFSGSQDMVAGDASGGASKEKKAEKEAKEKESEEKESERKVAYLTFDDGPSENTEKILNTLKEKEAVATFFVIGSELTEEKKGTVQKAVEQGNAVGIHTYCHESGIMYRDEKSFWEDYQKAEEVLREVTGKKCNLYRFPWGSNNQYVKLFVDHLHEQFTIMDVKCFDWNVSGEDSVGRNISCDTIFNNVKKDLLKYQQPIILLHDSAAMKNTEAVLGEIIDYIKREGYIFDTLENREEYMFPKSWR